MDTTVFVGKISSRTTQQDLYRLFAQCGKLKYAKLLRNGTAFVEFAENAGAVKSFLTLNKKNVDGSAIDVAFKRSKKDYFWPEVSPELRTQLLVDEVALYSVTPQSSAQQTAELVKSLAGENVAITDATACVGGNVMGFSRVFPDSKIVAVEWDKTRCDYLKHNLKICGIKNVDCVNDDYLKIMKDFKQDIVFMDPPWGGPEYKNQLVVDLFLGKTRVDHVCEQLKDQAKFIILKVPYNVNLDPYIEKVGSGVYQLAQLVFPKYIILVLDTVHNLEDFTNKIEKIDKKPYDYVKIYSKDHWVSLKEPDLAINKKDEVDEEKREDFKKRKDSEEKSDQVQDQHKKQKT